MSGFHPDSWRSGSSTSAAVTGTVTVDADTGVGVFVGTLTGNTTFVFPSSKVAGTEMILVLTQDGTGSRTVTWPSNFKKAGGTLTVTSTAAAVSVVRMVFDGTNWQELSRSLANA